MSSIVAEGKRKGTMGERNGCIIHRVVWRFTASFPSSHSATRLQDKTCSFSHSLVGNILHAARHVLLHHCQSNFTLLLCCWINSIQYASVLPIIPPSHLHFTLDPFLFALQPSSPSFGSLPIFFSFPYTGGEVYTRRTLQRRSGGRIPLLQDPGSGQTSSPGKVLRLTKGVSISLPSSPLLPRQSYIVPSHSCIKSPGGLI